MKRKSKNLPVLNVAVRKQLYFVILLLVLMIPLVSQAHWVKVTSLEVGNIISVAFDPGDSNVVFAGSDLQTDIASNTGLYRSGNAVQTWNQVTGTSLTGQPVRSISISPDNTATLKKMFIAVANQGIFRSTNNGTSWTSTQIQYPANSGMYLTQNISQVIVSKQQGTTQKIYAVVSNDENGNPNSAGIYVTTDDGANWNQVYQSSDIKKLIVHPTQPNTLYMATISTSELLRSTDGGTTFASANSGLPVGSGSFIVDIAVDPSDGNHVYASVFSNSAGGFYRSINGGTSWTKTSDIIVAHIAVSTSTSTQGRLYAVRNESTNTTVQYSVFQSADDGTTWARVEQSNSGLPGTTLNTITVDKDVVYVGGVDGLFRYDHNAGNISDPTKADISLQASANPVSPQLGQNLTYTLVVENPNTIQEASNIQVTSDPLPSGMRLVSAGTSSACSFDTSTFRISCSATRILANNGVTFAVVMRMPNTIPGNQFTARFSVTSSNDDNLDNNTAQVVSTIGSVNDSDLVANNSNFTVNVGSQSVQHTLNATSSAHTTVTYVITNNPLKGTIQFADGQTSQSTLPNITYTPLSGQTGADSFSYKIRAPDGHESNIATVSVNILGTSNNPGNGQQPGTNTTNNQSVGSGSLQPLLLIVLMAMIGLRRRCIA